MSESHLQVPLGTADRAMFHLELLGCFVPEDAVAPYEPELQDADWYDPELQDADWYDPDDEGGYLGEAVTCWGCGGEGNDIRCCDDICHGIGYCMHGDNYPCAVCGGEGSL